MCLSLCGKRLYQRVRWGGKVKTDGCMCWQFNETKAFDKFYIENFDDLEEDADGDGTGDRSWED